MNTRRERKSGRYVHCWCWQGYTRDGRQWEACCSCWEWRTGGRVQKAPERTYVSPTSSDLVYGEEAKT